MSTTHPLAAKYGDAPWVLHDEHTWTCLAHPDVAPFGPGISVDYSTPTSGFYVSNCCIECCCLLDEEVQQRRDWWLRFYAN